MTPKEMRRLNKMELVDIIVEQNAVINKLQIRIEQYEEQIRDRSMKIDEAGSLAEAALLVNGVIDTAQAAAQEYLDNIKTLNERTAMLCMQQEEESSSKCRAQEAAVKQKCEAMERAAEEKIAARWNDFTQKVDQYLNAHGELKEALKAAVTPIEK